MEKIFLNTYNKHYLVLVVCSRAFSNLAGRVGSGQEVVKSHWSGRVGLGGVKNVTGRMGAGQVSTYQNLTGRVGS